MPVVPARSIDAASETDAASSVECKPESSKKANESTGRKRCSVSFWHSCRSCPGAVGDYSERPKRIVSGSGSISHGAPWQMEALYPMTIKFPAMKRDLGRQCADRGGRLGLAIHADQHLHAYHARKGAINACGFGQRLCVLLLFRRRANPAS
jgi:hypothetical protein